MPELSDDYLKAVANAEKYDPHYLFKQQGKRQVQAILNVVNSKPQREMPPSDLGLAKQAAADLEAKLQSARDAHWRRFHGTTNSQFSQQSAQALARLQQEFNDARDHVMHLQQARQSRIDRGLPPDGNPPPTAA